MRILSFGVAAWLAAGASGLVQAADYIIDDDVYSGVSLGSNESLTITETGSINVGGQQRHAVRVTGNNNIITNWGSIVTTGVYSYGMGTATKTATDNTLINWGIIWTTGENSQGIRARGNRHVVTNAGMVASERSYSILLDPHP